MAPDIESNPDQLDVSHVFPNGAMSVRIANFPGTICKLSHDWRIFVSSNSTHSPTNIALQRVFGVEWQGNLVVMKYGKGNRRKMNNVPPSDKEFVAVLLQ